MPSPLHLSNTAARRLFLDRHALAEPPRGGAKGADLLALIERLGFVQIDSINTVARAHDLILFARRPSYRPEHLRPLLERDRQLFEHWTHDAAVIPTAFYPHWHLRFQRDRARLAERWRRWQNHGVDEKSDEVLARIARHGPVTSADVGPNEARASGGWWDWHPSKTALEYLWRTGALAVTRREGFRKVYDLSERVVPKRHRAPTPDKAETIDWACNAALDRLGFATSGEIAAFFATVTPAEAKAWCAAALARRALVEVMVEGADGAYRRSLARPGILQAAGQAPCPPPRVRVLSPFDPALRDRARTERLFGFRYRIEVFVPEARREYGYYVFPLLQGDRLIGRIDMKAHRDTGELRVRALWLEAGVRLGQERLRLIEAELARVARFAGCDRVGRINGWLKAP